MSKALLGFPELEVMLNNFRGIKACRGNSLALHPFFFTRFVSKSAFIFRTSCDIVPSIYRQPVQKDVTTSDTVEGYLTDT